MKKKLTIGILAHVDAGKTTLSEALLYISGKIRKLGRVDHKNTYLDTLSVERERGITVFSKQARFSSENCDFILLDTPGHIDFSAETERTLALLDYAILVVSAPDGVQNHTRTLWELLSFYNVPTFIFVNKTDISIKFKEDLEKELTKALSENIVAFYEGQSKDKLDEKLALVHEDFLESFLSGEPIDDSEISTLISERRLFPCVFGSALKMDGIEFLLDTIDRYTLAPIYESEPFGAKVYKIARAGSVRLTYMKITSGKLTARDELSYLSADEERLTEKVNEIRLYSGEKYDQAESVLAGEICAVSGLSSTYVGQGLGAEPDSEKPILEPVLSYRIKLPEGCDYTVYFIKLKEIEEEEPSLHLCWNEELQQIEARLMGDIQIDLLKRIIKDRFGIDCEFDTGRILYKEQVAQKALGVGHFEPLRHYAEVQVIVEPQPRGTGLIFDNRVDENSLSTNWQRLIMSMLYEKQHRGTLTGAVLTDTKITLAAGKAHLKHTEGGDFREASSRAVRNGLMKAGCVLLEPYYKFRLEVPGANVGRAMSDLQARSADFEVESSDGEISVICGRAPVSQLHGYARELISYTRGQGRISCVSDGYEPCHNQEEIVADAAYDPEADMENTPHSVFCSQGAGFVVPWNEVDEYKHIDLGDILSEHPAPLIPQAKNLARKYSLSEDELESIMLRVFGPVKQRRFSEKKVVTAEKTEKASKKSIKPPKRMVIVDGYNVIYAWKSLNAMAQNDLFDARKELEDILINYSAYTKTETLLVFDAYLVKDNKGSDYSQGNFKVVFTKQDQTADAYIEKTMHDLGPDYSIRVVTGDKLVQFAAVHSGILRVTPSEFEDEITRVGNEITEFARKLSERSPKNTPIIKK